MLQNTFIYEQLLHLVSSDEITEINIYCPFYDRDGKFLLNLTNSFPNSSLSVFLQEKNGNPPTEIEPNEKITFYSWSDVKRAKTTFKKFERKLHAKIFHFKSADFDYLLIGSPNATLAAFGGENRKAINEEFAVLYKLKSSDYIDSLGLACKNPKFINPKNLKRLTDLEGRNSGDYKLKPIRIVGADRNGRTVTVFTEKPVLLELFNILLLNSWGDILAQHQFEKSKEKEFHFTLDKTIHLVELAYMQIVDDSGILISNKQMVNNYDHLSRTNPSMENYLTLQLENKIDSENWDDLDIISFFNTIKNLEYEDKGSLKETNLNAEERAEKSASRSISSISYAQAVELMQEPDFQERLSKHHHSVRIWDSIYNYFNNLDEKSDESEQDDEEDGNISSGSDKAEKISSLRQIVVSSEKVFFSKQKQYLQMLSNYTKALDRCLEIPNRKISLVDICQYLIIIKTILRITERSVIYSTKEKIDDKFEIRKEDKEFLSVYGNFEELNNYSGAVLNVIGKFNLMLVASGKLETISDEYQKKKFEAYQNLTLTYSLFTLAALNQKHSQNTNTLSSKKWIKILAFDMLHIFEKRIIDYRKEFEKIAQHSSLKNFELDNAVDFVNRLNSSFLKKHHNIFFHESTGHCFVEKKIPADNPKFIKISKPGFSFNEIEDIFTLDKLFELKSGILIQSKQHFQKQKNQQ